MNILVTGANGQLGMELRALSKGSAHRYIFSDINACSGQETVYLDITDERAVDITARSEKVSLIINCAAYNNVAGAEKDLSFADALNHKAPAILAGVAASTGATLIHFSSDYVFGGSGNTPLPETAAAEPLGVYGATKLKGEKAIERSGCKYLIFRTAWLYSPYGKNFLKTTLDITAARPTMQVVCDQLGSPTYAADLAGFILGIIDKGQLDRTGLYHYTGEGICSWYDLAAYICSLSGHDCAVIPCRSGDYPSPARRPAYSVLDKTLVKKTFGITLPHWTQSVRACLDRMGQLDRSSFGRKI